MPKGFLFDVNKCTGCQACEIACTIENALDPGRSWRQVQTFNEFRYPEAPLFHLSMACNHCAEAPCMKSCPALAYSRDDTTGAVQIDAQACIGCRYCSWACPYDAPRYDADSGVMTKCTFCNHRLEQNLDPACVALCPTTALQYGELESERWVDTIPGFSQQQLLQPSIRFAALDERRPQPVFESHHEDSIQPAVPSRIKPHITSHITLRAEWPLALFTLTASFLVAWWVASRMQTVRLHPMVFLAVGIIGMGLGSAHLGKKSRAWRAILNIRSSWLSREIVLYSSFLLLCGTLFLLRPRQDLPYELTALIGFAALFAMDRVYDVAVRKTGDPFHSADVLLTGLYATTVLGHQIGLALVLATIKLVLYVRRKIRIAQQNNEPRWLWSLLRLASGFLLPALLLLLRPSYWEGMALACVAVGELIDRCEYYVEVETRTPQRQMEIDLRALLASSR